MMKYIQSKTGHLRVALSKNGKTKQFLIHRLVAHMFIPNPNNYPIINHRDENPSNNNVDNLEWCTYLYNNTYGTKIERSKNKKCKKIICLETKQIFSSLKEAGEWLSYEKWLNSGIASIISLCCQGKRSTAGGLHWQFLDDYRREQRMQSDINNSMAA